MARRYGVAGHRRVPFVFRFTAMMVALVGEQRADRLTIRCIANGWSELRRILTGANASVDGQREMAVNVKDGRELGPFPHRVALLTRAPDIVATDVPSL